MHNTNIAIGGFYYKDWITAGQKSCEKLVGAQLDNAIQDDEEKALGIYWDAG